MSADTSKSKKELERAVLEAARKVNGLYAGYPTAHPLLHKAVADLDEWERLRAEAKAALLQAQAGQGK